MPYVPLYNLLPGLAERETRTITVFGNNHYSLPPGNYGFVEMFCDEESCDCRRVIFMVMHSAAMQPIAYISFGWESVEYYAKWMGINKNEDVNEFGYS
jgi:hypothetical protein